ncbi:MAG: glycerol-3-phosphate acyltransferase [Dehalococcoidales bacterium]|nr:glycerol-3-phosphate acyltransferase [Dehalococcoidales bacterium]
MIVAKFIAVIVVGYLLGSIPFGVLVGRRMVKMDVRQHGSGKMGATNVLRTAGRKAAAVVAILDLLKGILAVTFAGLIWWGLSTIEGVSDSWWLLSSAQVAAGLAAVIGHIWPIFLKFRGGRGVAPFFGGLIALCPVAALFGGEALILGAGLSGFASLGSILGVIGVYTILVPLIIINGFPVEYLIYALAGTIIIIVMHRDNILRLMSGKERRLGDKVNLVPPTKGTG